MQPVPAALGDKVGISDAALKGQLPVHGLRIKPEKGTSGWYLWSGDWSEHPDFFLPLHVDHLASSCAVVVPYLQLPVGWRFVVAPDYEDVWFDEQLLK